MNRKAEKFFDAITLLREDLVEEAQDYVFRRKRTGWRRFGSLAACLMLVMSLGLLALPRGCGGAAPPQMNSIGSDFRAPADMPGDANKDAPYGDGQAGGSVDTAPSPEPSGDAPPVAEEQLRFTARVAEVLEDGLLVEPLEGGDLPEGAEQVRVPSQGLERLPAVRPGDVVAVCCEHVSPEDGGAVAEGVSEVLLLEPEG